MTSVTEQQERDDEAAIGRLLGQLVDAWNRGDGTAFGAVFDEDADYVVFNGIHLKGRAAIGGVHQQLFQTVLKGTRLDDSAGGNPGVRFLCPHVALMHSKGAVLRPDETEPALEQLSVQTFVFVKREGEWRITAFQNTRVQPLPAGAHMPPA
jgi:uncharacterized protein (TIGR02246 family)